MFKEVLIVYRRDAEYTNFSAVWWLEVSDSYLPISS
jgi:hypothetical protein